MQSLHLWKKILKKKFPLLIKWMTLVCACMLEPKWSEILLWRNRKWKQKQKNFTYRTKANEREQRQWANENAVDLTFGNHLISVWWVVHADLDTSPKLKTKSHSINS